MNPEQISLVSVENSPPLPVNRNSKSRKALRKLIKDVARREVWKSVLTGLGILGAITGFSIWAGIATIRTIVLNRIARQFEEPNIKRTVEEVAQVHAANLIRQQIQPELQQTRMRLDGFNDFLKNTRDNIQTDQIKMASEVRSLQRRNNILALADSAIATRSRTALEELQSVQANSATPQLSAVAASEVIRVKLAFAAGTRIEGVKIEKKSDSGTSVDEELLTVQDLIEALKNGSWVVRARAAELLGRKKEVGVPEALLQTIKEDRDLEVMKIAISSFARVTGYKSADVFGPYCQIESWWNGSQERVLSTLSGNKANKGEVGTRLIHRE